MDDKSETTLKSSGSKSYASTKKQEGPTLKGGDQFTSGLTDSLGIDPRVLLSSLMGSKLAGIGGKTEPK